MLGLDCWCIVDCYQCLHNTKTFPIFVNEPLKLEQHEKQLDYLRIIPLDGLLSGGLWREWNPDWWAMDRWFTAIRGRIMCHKLLPSSSSNPSLRWGRISSRTMLVWKPSWFSLAPRRLRLMRSRIVRACARPSFPKKRWSMPTRSMAFMRSSRFFGVWWRIERRASRGLPLTEYHRVGLQHHR